MPRAPEPHLSCSCRGKPPFPPWVAMAIPAPHPLPLPCILPGPGRIKHPEGLRGEAPKHLLAVKKGKELGEAEIPANPPSPCAPARNVPCSLPGASRRGVSAKPEKNICTGDKSTPGPLGPGWGSCHLLSKWPEPPAASQALGDTGSCCWHGLGEVAARC